MNEERIDDQIALGDVMRVVNAAIEAHELNEEAKAWSAEKVGTELRLVLLAAALQADPYPMLDAIGALLANEGGRALSNSQACRELERFAERLTEAME